MGREEVVDEERETSSFGLPSARRNQSMCFLGAQTPHGTSRMNLDVAPHGQALGARAWRSAGAKLKKTSLEHGPHYGLCAGKLLICEYPRYRLKIYV